MMGAMGEVEVEEEEEGEGELQGRTVEGAASAWGKGAAWADQPC